MANGSTFRVSSSCVTRVLVFRTIGASRGVLTVSQASINLERFNTPTAPSSMALRISSKE